MTPLTGRNAVITGGNQGLGLAIARAYVTAGARVLICARGEELLEVARRALVLAAGSEHAVVTEAADVSNTDDVTRLVARALEVFPQVHVLVNNAGVYGPMGAFETLDWTEWVRAIEINIHGSVLPSRALLPHFKERGYGKIIQVSGGGATNPLPRISAYATSKAAVVRFAESLALEVKGYNIDVNSIAPGALATRMLDEVLAAGPETVGREFYDRMVKTKEHGGTPLEVGAALAVFLGSAGATASRVAY